MMFARFIRRSVKIALDLAVMVGALVLAFLVRFEGLPAERVAVLLAWLPVVLVVKMGCFWVMDVLRMTWRHISLGEARRIVVALIMATLLLTAMRALAVADVMPWLGVLPIGVVVIDMALSALGIIGLRSTFRWWEEGVVRRSQGAGDRVPTLLVGAGNAGAWVARELRQGSANDILPVGFLDDDPMKTNTMIHGVPVLGTLDHLESAVQKTGATQLLITITEPEGDTARRIIAEAERLKLTARMVPCLREVIEGRVQFGPLREVTLEDLLRREPVQMDCNAVAEQVRGRTVLVTGAGGSIGSVLCQELCRFEPKALVLVEKGENALFHVHRQLSELFPEIKLVPHISDICDDIRMRGIFSRYRPEVVFHAAAHKHVPMMEWNPGEAIKNNVWGTRMLADLAHAFGAREFVMISTDKAVNPTSVMGVSKRVAELYVQALAQRSTTRFVTVRFGNVLGSNGSVVPIFKEQIARGGPVTVTDEKMKRYFMTIPEACQLVLQAATMGRGGEIFILDMGEPVRIVDLARDLIRLSGREPGKDIEIRFIGVRPGEKLYEELSLDGESAQKTRHPRILVGTARPLDWEVINPHLEELREVADSPDASQIHAKFKDVVPEYQVPASNPELLVVTAESGSS